MERIYPEQVAHAYPGALAMFGEELNVFDVEFYVQDGVLFSSSADERNAFRFVGSMWEEVEYPLDLISR